MIMTGEGGTKIDNHGIDVWTNGKPAHRFQILGTIDDARQDKLLSGDALSSKSIAEKVKEVGGNALLLGGQNSDYAGTLAGGSVQRYGNTAFANGYGRAVHNISTRFVVIKYLPD